MAANTASTNAKNAKKDEFYTMKRGMPAVPAHAPFCFRVTIFYLLKYLFSSPSKALP